MNNAVKLLEAKQECQRWFDYLQRQADKSKAMQELASERRKGTIDEHEACRRLQRLDSGVTVYDGANLEKAVRVLIAAMNAPTPREQELEAQLLATRETLKKSWKVFTDAQSHLKAKSYWMNGPINDTRKLVSENISNINNLLEKK
jgi:hypothetical protein